MTNNSWDHAARKLQEETHCSVMVTGVEELRTFFILTPDGKRLFSGVTTEEHVVQFVIDAVRVAWMEINQ